MQTYKWDTVPVEQLTDNIRRRMIVGTKEMLVKWEFKKGAIAARHSHPHVPNTDPVLRRKGK